jgi:hypothetical protein
VALARKAKGMSCPPSEPEEVLEERSMGLKDAATAKLEELKREHVRMMCHKAALDYTSLDGGIINLRPRF